MTREKETEEKIFEAARKEFYRNGYAGARMQDIADEADINKSMLHYYYRSKDKLFQAVYREGMRNFFPVVYKVLNSDLGLVPKIRELVDTYHEHFEKNPHLPSFVIQEMNQHPERFRKFVQSEGIELPEKFYRQVQAEIDSGSMMSITPSEFIVNIIGLCVFPFIAHSMIQAVFDMDDDQFSVFLRKRQENLPEFIFNAVNK